VIQRKKEQRGCWYGIWNVEHLRQGIIEACNAITPGIVKRVFLTG
jgi:hypothetical protein